VVSGLGTLLHMYGSFLVSLLATGLVAVLFQPLRAWLQRMVNRLMYGERDDPYAVLSRLGHRLEATLAPEAVLPAIVETVAQALKLPYAAIVLKQGDEFVPAASYGLSLGELLTLPLVYHTQIVGRFLLAPRAPNETFSNTDRRLLEDLASQAGVAAHAVRLTADLQRSASNWLPHVKRSVVAYVAISMTILVHLSKYDAQVGRCTSPAHTESSCC